MPQASLCPPHPCGSTAQQATRGRRRGSSARRDGVGIDSRATTKQQAIGFLEQLDEDAGDGAREGVDEEPAAAVGVVVEPLQADAMKRDCYKRPQHHVVESRKRETIPHHDG
eukprot:CAMPEP_0169482290 /NCGR_PEP_ID=MMETSP1042-20121227/30601_1 /TAXON_ID=464988 /ORGANISM="Hemiselmis andersenii, Strain CCMP1180" /LENGTH=111 /DNA_ID=CAMNT_0009597157 /DNA_START=43 /DNA_END=379 /DNA_ORIENTATION=-